VPRLVALAALSLSLLFTACQPGASGITFAPSQGNLRTLDDMSAACAISTAWGGSASTNPIPTLDPCSLASPPYRSLPSGSLVTTSTCGQAWLQVSGCGKLYVFHTTKLVASFCAPSYASTAGCVTTGTAAWSSSGCTGDIELGTPSASIRLAGTWASVTYVEELQLSLMVQLDGTGDAVPFIDLDAQRIGDPTRLNPNEFWFTAPGDAGPVVADVEGRVAQPLERLPAVIHELGLESWFAEVFDRAALDGFDVAQIAPLAVVQARVAGLHLDDAAVRNAVWLSYDWGPKADQLLPDGPNVTLAGLAADEPVVDLRSQLFDPAFSQTAIKEAGGFGVDVIWAKGNVEPFATALVEALRLVGLDATPVGVADDAAASEAFEAAIGREGDAIWLTNP
jgi:hypothetical protein